MLHALDAQFGISSAAEVSMEADPGTFDAAKLMEYRRLGVNRLSVGVQSFQQVRAVAGWSKFVGNDSYGRAYVS